MMSKERDKSQYGGTNRSAENAKTVYKQRIMSRRSMWRRILVQCLVWKLFAIRDHQLILKVLGQLSSSKYQKCQRICEDVQFNFLYLRSFTIV